MKTAMPQSRTGLPQMMLWPTDQGMQTGASWHRQRWTRHSQRYAESSSHSVFEKGSFAIAIHAEKNQNTSHSHSATAEV